MMAHGVGLRHLAEFLLVERLEVAGHRGQLRFVANQCDRLGVEGFHIGACHLRRITRRVDADEHHLQLVGILAHQVFDLAQLDHGGRAHIRAAGETEEQVGHLPLQVLRAAHGAVAVGHRPLLAKFFTGDVLGIEVHARLRTAAGQQADGQACQQRQAETGREQRTDNSSRTLHGYHQRRCGRGLGQACPWGKRGLRCRGDRAIRADHPGHGQLIIMW